MKVDHYSNPERRQQHLEEDHKKAKDRLKKDKTISDKNKKLVFDFLKASAIGKITGKESALKSRHHMLFSIKIIIRGFKNKDLDKLSLKDIEKFIRDLQEDKIKKTSRLGTKRGETIHYSEGTKLILKNTLVNFLKWLYGRGDKFYKLTDWIDRSRVKKSRISALNEEEIRKLILSCKTIKSKVFLSFLFCSGSRMGEMLQLRIGDLNYDEKLGFYKVSILDEYSKTIGRIIPLNMEGLTELINSWLAIHPDGKNQSALLFPYSYDSYCREIRELGRKVLNKDICANTIRHSSATFDSKVYNRYQLCYKYGWVLSSGMPNIYIDREEIKLDTIYPTMKFQEEEKESELTPKQINLIVELAKKIK